MIGRKDELKRLKAAYASPAAGISVHIWQNLKSVALFDCIGLREVRTLVFIS